METSTLCIPNHSTAYNMAYFEHNVWYFLCVEAF